MNIPAEWTKLFDTSAELKELFEEQYKSDKNQPVPPFLFHQFRPNRYEALEGLFHPFPYSNEVFEKLKEVYDACLDNYYIGNLIAAYFVPQKQVVKQEELEDITLQYIREMNQIILESNEDSVVDLEHVTIKFMTREAFEQKYDIYSINEADLDDLKYDWFTELLPDQKENPLVLFEEAFYYIACSYDLARYISWPMTGKSEEENPFRSFFKLWKLRYKPWIVNKQLVVLTEE